MEGADLLVGNIVGAMGHAALDVQVADSGNLCDAMGSRQEPARGQDRASAGVLHVGDSPSHGADERCGSLGGITTIDDAVDEPLRWLRPQSYSQIIGINSN